MSEIKVTLIDDEDNVDESGEITFELEEGTEYIVNDSRNLQVIDLDDPSISQEVEVVTIESSGEPSQTQLINHSSTHKISKTGIKSSNMGMQALSHRIKSAPALLRNSRRFQNHVAEQFQPISFSAASGGSLSSAEVDVQTTTENSAASMLPPASANFMVKGQRQTTPSGSGASHSQSILSSTSNQNFQHAVLLDENGQPTDEFVVLQTNESGEYSIVDRGTTLREEDILNSPDHTSKHQDDVMGQTIIICQDPESNQYHHMIEDEDGNYIPIEASSMPYHQIDDGTIYFDESGTFEATTNYVIADNNAKSKPKSKKTKKPLQVIIGPDGKPLKKKGQTELKCMEKGCIMTCFNVNELRKHLTLSHGLNFDEEIVTFSNDAEFKRWRETYERERMVSFIYRGGTKKIAKDQSVTYMICHRSGHYKPTMTSESKRQRKMKPQGSCKMGGYCTAGIKLLRNLDSGEIRMDICHTHYGHPLDSDAIPHLRVNPTLRKIILGKFKAGLTFTEVLAYIHHNPDRLEGLRLVDRRAVRNIFDSWKNPTRRSKQAQKDIDDLQSSSEQSKKEIDSADDDCDESMIISNLMEPSSKHQDEQLELPEVGSSSKLSEHQNSTVCAENDDGPPVLIRAVTERETRKRNNGRHMDVQGDIKIDDEEDADEDDTMSCKKRPRRSSVKNEENTLILNPPSSTRSYGLRPNRKVEVYSNKNLKSKKPDTEKQLLQTESKNKKPVKSPEKKSLKNSNKLPTRIVDDDDNDDDTEDDVSEETQPPMIISETLALAMEKLNDHCESGPTVLLYKPIGNSVKYGESKGRDFRKDDFCVVLQSPVQRQLLQMFPDIISYEVLDGPKSSESQLKLSFLMVLDEFREAIPVAWLVSNVIESRIIASFFKAMRKECGELRAKYFMSPRYSDAHKLWCSTYETKPLPVLNDIEVKRDLKSLVWHEFSTDKGRREVWELMESLISERHAENLDISSLEEKFEPLLDKLPHSGEFIEKLERDWLSRTEEWAYCYRYGVTTNIMGSSNSFTRLKKFVSFKGTRNLHESFEHILKIGYDKCFLRSKRIFKGDQKHSLFLEKIKNRHTKARGLQNVTVAEGSSEDSWVVCLSEKVNPIVTYVNSPCDCKLLCLFCKICIHMYICTCSDYTQNQMMCEHIHYVHCNRNNIPDEGEFITGDLNSDVDGVFGKIETSGTEENPGAIINIEAVLKAAGLFHRSDGLQPDQIISITDADTQTVIYEHHPASETVKGTQPQPIMEIIDTNEESSSINENSDEDVIQIVPIVSDTNLTRLKSEKNISHIPDSSNV